MTPDQAAMLLRDRARLVRMYRANPRAWPDGIESRQDRWYSEHLDRWTDERISRLLDGRRPDVVPVSNPVSSEELVSKPVSRDEARRIYMRELMRRKRAAKAQIGAAQ